MSDPRKREESPHPTQQHWRLVTADGTPLFPPLPLQYNAKWAVVTGASSGVCLPPHLAGYRSQRAHPDMWSCDCPLTLTAGERARAGIGKSLTEKLASQGINVVLVALQVLRPHALPPCVLSSAHPRGAEGEAGLGSNQPCACVESGSPSVSPQPRSVALASFQLKGETLARETAPKLTKFILPWSQTLLQLLGLRHRRSQRSYQLGKRCCAPRRR